MGFHVDGLPFKCKCGPLLDFPVLKFVILTIGPLLVAIYGLLKEILSVVIQK